MLIIYDSYETIQSYVVSVLDPAIVSKTVNHVDEQILRNAVLRVLLAVHVAAELLPLHPSLHHESFVSKPYHGGSQSQTIVQSNGGSNQGKKHSNLHCQIHNY